MFSYLFVGALGALVSRGHLVITNLFAVSGVVGAAVFFLSALRTWCPQFHWHQTDNTNTQDPQFHRVQLLNSTTPQPLPNQCSTI
jgi:hypothetical protein